MKSIIFVLIILSIFFITTSEKETQEDHTNTIETQKPLKKPILTVL